MKPPQEKALFLIVISSLGIGVVLGLSYDSPAEVDRKARDSLKAELPQRLEVVGYQEFENNLQTWIMRDERTSCEFLITRVYSGTAVEKIGCYHQ